MATNQELQRELRRFAVVHVNWSKENKNPAAMERLGHPEELGFPTFVVLSPQLKVLHTQESSSFETPDARHPGHDPVKLLTFLKAWDGATDRTSASR